MAHLKAQILLRYADVTPIASFRIDFVDRSSCSISCFSLFFISPASSQPHLRRYDLGFLSLRSVSPSSSSFLFPILHWWEPFRHFRGWAGAPDVTPSSCPYRSVPADFTILFILLRPAEPWWSWPWWSGALQSCDRSMVRDWSFSFFLIGVLTFLLAC